MPVKRLLQGAPVEQVVNPRHRVDVPDLIDYYARLGPNDRAGPDSSRGLPFGVMSTVWT